MTLEDLAARLRRLEDIEEIRKLKATYCYLCDAGLTDPRICEELVGHFADDARVDFGMGPASIFQGKDGLRTFFGTMVPSGVSFCVHMVHNPIIDVQGNRATGRWYFEAPTTDTGTGRAQWMMGTYHEEYVRDDGRWKFAAIRTEWKYITPFDEGWARNRGALLAALAGEA